MRRRLAARRESLGNWSLLKKLGLNLVALTGLLAFTFPLYYVFVGSTLAPGELFQFPPRLLPGTSAIENYSTLLFDTRFPRMLLNSLVYAVSSALGVLLVSSTAGYVYAKAQFPGRKPLFYLTLVTLAVPFQIIAIPLFELLSGMDLIDSMVGLVLPTVAHPLGVFYMKQNIEQNVLDDVLNSARIDGASEFAIYYRVVLPLVKPGLISLGVLMILFKMNDLFWPLIVMRSQENQVVTIFMSLLAGGIEEPTPWETVLPAMFVSTLPVLLLFVFLQRYFVQGLLAGSVKQ